MGCGNVLRAQRNAALLLAGTLGLCGCLPDAPAPSQCPPSAPANSCGSVQPNNGDTCGVTRDDARKCLGLAVCKSKCESADQQCPATAEACYPPGDCPAAVTAAAPGSACVRLPSNSFQENQVGCTCGCAACMAVCDGTGLIVYRNATQSEAGSQALLTTIDLQGVLPDRGTLSLYAVLRGTGTLHVEATDEADNSIATADFRKKLTAPWEDFVPLKVGSKNLSWGAEPASSRPPKRLSLYAAEGTVALEIDCLIPVVKQQ